MITVGIVDDHEVFRMGVRTGLLDARGIEVAWECSTGEEALEHMAEGAADVVVLDFNLGPRSTLSGIDTCRALTVRWPSTAVLIVTALGQVAGLAEAAGAAGVIEKDRPFAQLVSAVRSLASGVQASPRRGKRSPRSIALSEREDEILALTARGATSAMVARKLGIAPKTVDNHVQNILRKLNARNRVQAAAIFSSRMTAEDRDSGTASNKPQPR
ncbi:MAG TPA: response regulator transcription factor [Candidatus Dormibacteraeota bacterium]